MLMIRILLRFIVYIYLYIFYILFKEIHSLYQLLVCSIGNEGKGLQTSVERVCTHMLTIPSFRELGSGDSIESLNVSVATGVILYSLQTSGRSCKTIS